MLISDKFGRTFFSFFNVPIGIGAPPNPPILHLDNLELLNSPLSIHKLYIAGTIIKYVNP